MSFNFGDYINHMNVIWTGMHVWSKQAMNIQKNRPQMRSLQEADSLTGVCMYHYISIKIPQLNQ